jgi:PIN domain nuclease of toxin-antitoxin system
VYGYLDHLHTLGATELSITSAHALSAGGLRHEHRDPFDRIIAAQSLLERIPLVSADPIFRDLAVMVYGDRARA